MKDPQVSVVILTKNAGPQFLETLEMIFKQKLDAPFEVIVIDSGSQDETLSICDDYPVKVFKIKPEEFNFGLTRDFGFEKATGEYIVTISQDVIPVDENWLANLLKPFLAERTVAVVQGVSVVPDDKPVFYWERVGLFYFTRETKRWIRHFSIGLSFVNIAIRKDIWAENKIGDAMMSEDKVFQKKISTLDHRVVLERSSKVYHWHNYNVISLAKRCANEGVGWRCVGVRYSLLDMFLDIFNVVVYSFLFYGILTFRVRKLAELLFPIIRPVFLYVGNNNLKRYIY